MIPETLLRNMMSTLIDFVNEETLLQYHGKMLGVIVDRSPKCHPEVAGEGIEYSWGCSKGKYRRLPFKDGRTTLEIRFVNVWTELLYLPLNGNECSANAPGNTCLLTI